MSVLIPIAWVCVTLALIGVGRGLRESAIVGLTAVGVLVLVFTEALSVPRALLPLPLAACWIAAIAIVAVGGRQDIAAGARRVRSAAKMPHDRGDAVFAGVLGLFALGTLLSAVLYPITNYDSLTYHMTRVFMWVQNHSVALYPTDDPRQLFSGPLVEYFVLQLKLLSGGSERLANLVQWASYVFVAVAASLVAARLGARKRGQQVAALVAAVTPMAVLQASTTQNDLTCAMWSLVAIYWVVDYVSSGAPAGGAGLWRALALGSAFALASQSKPTAYLLLLPFLVWLAVAAVRRESWKHAVTLGVALALVIVALNAGWYVRNARALPGDPLALSAPGNAYVQAGDRDPGDVLTTLLKNGSMQFGTPSVRVNRAIASTVGAVVRLYGGDIENPLNKEDVAQTYVVDEHVVNHDIGPSPLVAALVILSAVAVLVRRGPQAGIARWYLTAVAVAFVAVAGLIKWNYFINRVTLGVLLAGVPLVGLALGGPLERTGRRLAGFAIAGVLALTVAWGGAVMLFNTTNRLVPPSLLPVQIGNRDVGYWNTSYADLKFQILVGPLQVPLESIAGIIEREGIERIALDQSPGNLPIYPLFTLLPDRRFEYVDHLGFDVRDAPRFAPEAVLVIRQAEQSPVLPAGPTARGEIIYGPETALGCVFTLYDVR